MQKCNGKTNFPIPTACNMKRDMERTFPLLVAIDTYKLSPSFSPPCNRFHSPKGFWISCKFSNGGGMGYGGRGGRVLNTRLELKYQGQACGWPGVSSTGTSPNRTVTSPNPLWHQLTLPTKTDWGQNNRKGFVTTPDCFLFCFPWAATAFLLTLIPQLDMITCMKNGDDHIPASTGQ